MFSPLTGAEISVTAAATATLGRMHVCSGTSADYALTLPAASGNAGKFVGVRISSACTRWITVTGNGAELIDGSNTRRMWQRESAILMCDGTGWTKVAGKSIPIKAAAIRSTTYNVTSGTWDIIPVNSSLFDNTSALAVPALDLTAGRIRVLRAGEYQLSGRVSVTGVTAQRLFAGGAVCGNFTAGPGPLSPGAWSSAAAPTGGVAGGFCYGSGSTVFSAATSQFFYTTCFLDDTTTRATNTGTDTAPFVAVAELPSW